ncbi:MAG: potassium transporter Kup [Acidimicrobiales bacterium]
MEHRQGKTLGLSVAALGVVYGDIGTSPLYALRESLGGEHDLDISEANVLGVLSLIFWALVIVITFKYLILVMRADNDGEGGILALAALANRRRTIPALVGLGLFGTALLYGDGMITPAISVLSAVEGIGVAAPTVSDWIQPISALILIALFAIQHRGTETIGALFGPIMIIWFAVLGVLGAVKLVDQPGVLAAIDPTKGLGFLVDHGFRGFLVLGSTFLVVTGGEALYADMGHFGRRPIEIGWYAVVLPGLMLNYLGQGALLLDQPDAISSPFYLLAPSWAQWPLTVLATLATVIASQALITGAFSLTTQAINLDYLPRLRTVQTSEHSRGQVYVPSVNWFLLAACLTLVFTFGSSSRLAAAYGVAVTLTMVITTILVARVAQDLWGWSPLKVAVITIPLLVVDLAFAIANLFKIPHGGWFPLVIGVLGFIGFTTWRTGRHLVSERISRKSLSVEELATNLSANPPPRHPGTGVYLYRTPGQVPPVLLTNMRYNESLHTDIVVLSVVSSEEAHVPTAARHQITHHPAGFHELQMRYGFAERPDLGRDLPLLTKVDVSFDLEQTTFFFGRENISVTDRPGMAEWRERLFAFMHRNAADPASYFGIPTERSVDIGTHVDI